MKKKLIFLLTALSLVFASCDKGDDGGVVAGEPRFSTSSTGCEAWCGELVLGFDANNSGTYKFSSFNEDIATVAIRDTRADSVVVRILGVGRVTIKAENVDDPQQYCYCNIMTTGLEGMSMRLAMGQKVEKCLKVEVKNAAVRDIIEKELLKELADRYYAVGLSFYPDDGFLTVRMNNAGNSFAYDGSYEVDYPEQRLVLRYNGQEETFRLDGHTLLKDYTDHYRQKYPQSGVEKAALSLNMYW